MNTEEKLTYWQQHIDSWKNSGLSQQNYCKQNELTFSSFGYWRGRLKKNQAASGKLIPVSISRASLINIYLPSGVRIETPAHGLAEILLLLTGGEKL